MSKMYSKSGRGNEKFLYDSSGKVVGRGVTDKNGKTIYSGSGGYIGKSYETGHGTVKHFDSDNNYVGGGIKRSNVTTVVGKENDDAPHSPTPFSSNTNKSKSEAEGCLMIICYIIIFVAVISLITTLSG